MNPDNHNDDKDIIAAGYKPQLHRRIGFFASFAFSFSFMSVLMGIFANYGYVLGKAGPFGLWTWLIVGTGQLLVALVFAEMAGRIPLTGALYNWNNKLSHPAVAVTVHWLTVFAYTIGGSGLMVVLMEPLQSLLGKTFTMPTIYLIGTLIFLLQLLISVFSIRLSAYITKIAVILEILAILIFGSILAAVVIIKGQAHPGLLTALPKNPALYLPAFLVSTLLGAWTIFGFETPSDFSEETIQAKHVTPKSILISVATSVLLGFFLIVILTAAIPNLSTITNARDPVTTIVSIHLGDIATKIFLCCVILATFATSLLSISLAARLLFAVSRDKHFIAYKKFTQISSQGIPFYASLLVALTEILVFRTMYGTAALYASAVVLLFTAYLITVINFALGIKKLPPTKNFSLGKWHWPVVILACIWLIAQILILTVPKEFHVSAIIGAGILIFSSFQYLLHKIILKKI